MTLPRPDTSPGPTPKCYQTGVGLHLLIWRDTAPSITVLQEEACWADGGGTGTAGLCDPATLPKLARGLVADTQAALLSPGPGLGDTSRWGDAGRRGETRGDARGAWTEEAELTNEQGCEHSHLFH